MKQIALLLTLLAFGASAQAYELRAKSESILNTAPELAQMVKAVGDEVGNNLPQTDKVRVHVISEARLRENSQEIIYNHRVELRKVFDGRKPPYPMAGWLVIYTSEIYGIGTEGEARAQLDATIRKFFADLKSVDPKTQSP